jgi:hypothetical protein
MSLDCTNTHRRVMSIVICTNTARYWSYSRLHTGMVRGKDLHRSYAGIVVHESQAIQHLQYVPCFYSKTVQLWQQMSYRASLEPLNTARRPNTARTKYCGDIRKHTVPNLTTN